MKLEHTLFKFTASDTAGNSPWDTVSVIVRPAPRDPNRRPEANAGPDKDILFGTICELSGSGTDPEGDKLSFRWINIDNVPNLVFSSLTQQTIRISKLRVGISRFGLRVEDSQGLWDVDTVEIRVLPPINHAPKAYAGPGKFIRLPLNSVELRGEGSDPDGDRITVLWRMKKGPRPCFIKESNELITMVHELAVGDYQMELIVKDRLGLTAMDSMTISVIEEFKPPIANAGPDQKISDSKKMTLNGSGVDSDGEVVKFTWRKVSGPDQFNIVSDAERITVVDSLVKGVYEFELTVTDNDGLQDSDLVVVEIIESDLTWLWVTIFVLLGFILIWLVPNRNNDSIWPFFWWWKQKKKVIAFFMDDTEKGWVRKLMPKGELTEGFSVGHCNKSNIKQMSEKGIAFQILNTDVLTVRTPGMTKIYTKNHKGKMVQIEADINSDRRSYRNVLLDDVSLKHNDSELEIISENYSPFNKLLRKGMGYLRSYWRRFKSGRPGPFLVEEANLIKIDYPSYFIITLDGPLLDDYIYRLNGIGIEILQRIPDDSYLIQIINARQLNKLLGSGKVFGFIRVVSHYSMKDTGFIVRTNNFDREKFANEKSNLTLDLLLHKVEYMDEVTQFLNNNSMEIIDIDTDVIRINVSVNKGLEIKLASNKFIQAIFEYIPPVLHNDVVRHIVGIDAEVAGHHYIVENGSDEIIAVADTGIYRDHPDLSGSFIDVVSIGRKRTDDTSDPHGHGTHVTGTIVGNGKSTNGEIKGIAPGAKIFFQSLLDYKGKLCNLELKLPQLLKQAYEQGARIMNISWGSATESYYTFDSSAIDKFMYKHPEMLVVVSAGNEGSCTKGKSGYPDSGSIGSPATTKNGLCVGASRTSRLKGGQAEKTYGEVWKDKFPDPPTSHEKISGDFHSLAAFSSRGPCKDRRIKPDIVAPGTDILSTISIAAIEKYNGVERSNLYGYLSGTSMSTPIVSGAAAIVREYFRKSHRNKYPSAALIKATLINGTKKLEGKSALNGNNMIPNSNQGYGMLDLSLTIPNKRYNFRLWYRDNYTDKSHSLISVGHTHFYELKINRPSWIRVCLVFTDNPKSGVQNDIDLIMGYIDSNGKRHKWAGNEGINKRDPDFSDQLHDFTNNIEIIRPADEEVSAGKYTIEVVCRTNPLKTGLNYALVVTTDDFSAEFT